MKSRSCFAGFIMAVCLIILTSFINRPVFNDENAGIDDDIGRLTYDTSKPYLGANYNEFFEQVNFSELEDTNTKWIRGFFDFFELYEENSLLNNKRIKAYLGLNKAGYHTVINIKFNFKTRKFPEKDSKEWKSYFEFLDKILSAIMERTDVVVVGNEPFLEARTEDFEAPLNTFYAAACMRVHQYFIKHNITKPIFLGAFLNNYWPKYQTQGIKELLEFAKSTNYIAGIDVHIHHEQDSEMIEALEFLNDKIRGDQKIIISEFSLVTRWKKHLTDSISSEFLAAANQKKDDKIYPPPSNIKLAWQYIGFAVKNPRSLEEWNAFCKHTRWLENSKDYLCTSFSTFKNYSKFWLAFYAIRQQYPSKNDFGPDTTPWLLNGVLAVRTVELKDGKPQGRYGFYENYKDINAEKDACTL